MEVEEALALGKFYPGDLIVSVSESSRKIDPAMEGRVDAIWEETKKKAEAEGRVCYNGISYRLNRLERKGDKIIIDFGLLQFKVRQTLPTIAGYLDLPVEYHHRGCHSAATVRTSDARYLVVELSGKSMNLNAVDMIGGIVEKPSEIEIGKDVFSCLDVELEEEARIKKEDIKDEYLRAIFLTPTTFTCFYFEIDLSVSSEELLKRFDTEVKDQDIRSLKALSQEEYKAFLMNHSSPTKKFIAEVMRL